MQRCDNVDVTTDNASADCADHSLSLLTTSYHPLARGYRPFPATNSAEAACPFHAVGAMSSMKVGSAPNCLP
jgi:hypothetical protein